MNNKNFYDPELSGYYSALDLEKEKGKTNAFKAAVNGFKKFMWELLKNKDRVAQLKGWSFKRRYREINKGRL